MFMQVRAGVGAGSRSSSSGGGIAGSHGTTWPKEFEQTSGKGSGWKGGPGGGARPVCAKAPVDAASRMKSTTERTVSPGFALLVIRSRPVSRAAFFIDGAFSRFAGVNLGAIVVEHEQP